MMIGTFVFFFFFLEIKTTLHLFMLTQTQSEVAYLTVDNYLRFQKLIQVHDVAYCEPQYFDFRQFLIGRYRRQEFTQFAERHVECLHSDSLACGMCHSVFLRGPPSSPPFFPGQRGHSRHGAFFAAKKSILQSQFTIRLFYSANIQNPYGYAAV